jgi:dihydroflavonol-4-reductase
MSTVLVTGATGLTGSNVCELLMRRGDHVRALVRAASDSSALAGLGVELIAGDVTDAETVMVATKGCDGVIHCAALLGGSSQDLAEFEAVNTTGTRNVLDAAVTAGTRRVVAVSTGTFFDTTTGAEPEDAPIAEATSSDPYTVTKLAAFRDAMARAAAGQDVVTCHPGAIYGPAPVVSRALARTSFNRVLSGALRGKLGRYLAFPVSWVFAADVAGGCIAALDVGVSGERYMLDGRPEDVMSVAAACNRACELAGLDYRVEDVAPSDDPALAEAFGPTLVSIASKAGGGPRVRPAQSKTTRRLGYSPTSLDDGLRELIDWLRAVGRLE